MIHCVKFIKVQSTLKILFAFLTTLPEHGEQNVRACNILALKVLMLNTARTLPHAKCLLRAISFSLAVRWNLAKVLKTPLKMQKV